MNHGTALEGPEHFPLTLLVLASCRVPLSSYPFRKENPQSCLAEHLPVSTPRLLRMTPNFTQYSSTQRLRRCHLCWVPTGFQEPPAAKAPAPENLSPPWTASSNSILETCQVIAGPIPVTLGEN